MIDYNNQCRNAIGNDQIPIRIELVVVAEILLTDVKSCVFLTVALVEPVSMVSQSPLLVMDSKFFKFRNVIELGGNGVTVYHSWVAFDFVVFLYLNDC